MDYMDKKLKEIELELENAERELKEIENISFEEIKEANANENDNTVNRLIYELRHKKIHYNYKILNIKKKKEAYKKKFEKQLSKLSKNIIYMTRNDLN
jgi:hypothetical protein